MRGMPLTGCEAESSRKHFAKRQRSFRGTMALFTATGEKRSTKENSYIFYLRTSFSRVFFSFILFSFSHQRSFSFFFLSNLWIERRKQMWQKNNKLDAQFLSIFIVHRQINNVYNCNWSHQWMIWTFSFFRRCCFSEKKNNYVRKRGIRVIIVISHTIWSNETKQVKKIK